MRRNTQHGWRRAYHLLLYGSPILPAEIGLNAAALALVEGDIAAKQAPLAVWVKPWQRTLARIL